MTLAPDIDTDRMHVVAAVIRRDDGHLLVSRRPPHVDQGNLWEFPGGKVQAGEPRLSALCRELQEELGIEVVRALPLLRVPHDYPKRRVLLDVFVVDRWRGHPHGREGQETRWVAPAALSELAFPAANLPIVTAARLPRTCVVTPEPGADETAFLAALEACLTRGVSLVQLRAPGLPRARYLVLAQRVLTVCRARGARLLLNADPALVREVGADGVHLNAHRLDAMQVRPLPADYLVGASCHNGTELTKARRLGVDFVFLSPVLRTTTHPDATPLGWPAVAAMLAPTGLPAYALGGVGPAQLTDALRAGFVGVAGIGAFWGGEGRLDDAALTDGVGAGPL